MPCREDWPARAHTMYYMLRQGLQMSLNVPAMD